MATDAQTALQVTDHSKPTSRPATPPSVAPAAGASPPISSMSTTNLSSSQNADDSCKIYVSNLQNFTDEETLKNHFSRFGNVVSVNIIRRFRSRHFAFVVFDSPSGAEKATSSNSLYTVDNKVLKVERVVPKEQLKSKRLVDDEEKKRRSSQGMDKRAGRQQRNRAAGNRENRSFSAPENNEVQEIDAENQEKRNRRYTRYRYRYYSSRRTRTAEGENPEFNRYRGRFNNNRRRGGYYRKYPNDRQSVPSEKAIFVANLDYRVTNEEFSEFFKSKDYNVVEAYVVHDPRNRSKGFGFVEFESQEDQQRAMSELNDYVLYDRKLAIRVRLDRPEKEQEESAV